MPRPSRIASCVVLAWIGAATGRQALAGEFAFHHENVMGTSLEMRVLADDRTAASRAEDRALREIDRLSAIFSNHEPTSEFRRWQSTREGPAAVSPELFEVLRASDRWREASRGAFDPRVQALAQLWKGCAREGRTPTPEELATVKAAMGRPAWRLDPEARTAECLAAGPLSLDGIAKGFIVELACAAAMRGDPAVLGVLLNAGGDLRVRGDFDRTVGITPPRGDSEAAEPFAFVRVRDRAVATSGDYQRGLAIGGRWYSHIFDPRTGLPAAGVASATVIAESSADADALATILNVLPPEEGVRLVGGVPGAECLIVAADGRIIRSDGWHRHEAAGPAPPALAFGRVPPPAAGADGPKPEAKPSDSRGDAFEMLVDFEIKKPEDAAGRYRRPYVAIWLDDKDGNHVRNLVLWVSLGGSGPERWLPDLKRWYRGDQARKDDIDLVHSVGRATRPPGKYSVLWDGKDNHGKPLPRGEYTLNIEAAREHGTYQIIRKTLTIADTPFAEELKGNAEIQSAAIAYRRKAPGAK